MDSKKIPGELITYLPQVLQEDVNSHKFLLAFEKIFLGRTNADQHSAELIPAQGLEKIIDRLATYFDPETEDLPSDFLLWLGQWVALSLRLDVDEETRKLLTAKAVQLYRYRGTKKNMHTLLRIFTKREPLIDDQSLAQPYFFTVALNLNDVREGDSKEDYNRAIEKAHSVIRSEKPAHTTYEIIPIIDTVRIGKKSETDYHFIVGKNTRLGIAKWKKTLEGGTNG